MTARTKVLIQQVIVPVSNRLSCSIDFATLADSLDLALRSLRVQTIEFSSNRLARLPSGQRPRSWITVGRPILGTSSKSTNQSHRHEGGDGIPRPPRSHVCYHGPLSASRS